MMVSRRRERPFPKLRALSRSWVLGLHKALPPLVPALPPPPQESATKPRLEEVYLRRRDLKKALTLWVLQTLLARLVPSTRCLFAADGLRSVTLRCCATHTLEKAGEIPDEYLGQRGSAGWGGRAQAALEAPPCFKGERGNGRVMAGSHAQAGSAKAVASHHPQAYTCPVVRRWSRAGRVLGGATSSQCDGLPSSGIAWNRQCRAQLGLLELDRPPWAPPHLPLGQPPWAPCRPSLRASTRPLWFGTSCGCPDTSFRRLLGRRDAAPRSCRSLPDASRLLSRSTAGAAGASSSASGGQGQGCLFIGRGTTGSEVGRDIRRPL